MTVMTQRVFRMSGSGMVMMSADSTVRSASLPDRNRPFDLLFEGRIRRPDREHLQRLRAGNRLLGMPAFAGESLLALARDGGVELDHRLAALDRRIGAARDNRAGLQQALPRIRAGESLLAPVWLGAK